jgi:hypothetical protein
MAVLRTADDLTIYIGAYRSFEWFWEDDGTMPGLDAYESLSPRDQDDLLASVMHWGNTPPGQQPLKSRVNVEHTDPLVLAIKAGKHRFTAFREDSGPTWIVHSHYLKEGNDRDKSGDRAIERTKRALTRYFALVRAGKYYERT